MTTPSPRVSAQDAMAFADGALGAAGHAVTDPYIREQARRRLNGEITMEEYSQLVNAHIDAK